VAFRFRAAEHEKECLKFLLRVHCPAAKGACMQLLYSRCCGIDVHKDSVTACVLIYSGSPEPEVRKKEFATHKRALGYLSSWLHANQVTHVAMESTGVYWKPVWQALEGKFDLTLANPYQIKAVPGRKTDARDSQWIAELLAHGLIRRSFVPPQDTRNLRDLTRYRVKLVEEHNRIHNRIHKVLEDACLKLDTVASDILGVSGRRIIRAILAGHEEPGYLAYEARGTLRGKMPQLRLALSGRLTDHHRFLLRELMDDLERIESKIQRLEAAIAQRVDMRLVERLCSIPGVDVITAWTLLAELGSDMGVFDSPKHAASWAGLCPGNHESGGKRLSNRTRKGNRWLRRALVQSAWGASRKKDCFLAAFFYRHAARQGVRKAIVSLAHRILVIAFCLLRDATEYQEFGGDFFDQLNPVRTRNRLIRRLQRLGVTVALSPNPDFPVIPPASLRRKKPGRPCKCAERLIHCMHKT
jgi:transposase